MKLTRCFVLDAMITAILMTCVIVLSIRLQPGLEGVFISLTLAVGVVEALSFYLQQSWESFLKGILGYTGIAVWKTIMGKRESKTLGVFFIRV